jgi:hypothetical protein
MIATDFVPEQAKSVLRVSNWDRTRVSTVSNFVASLSSRVDIMVSNLLLKTRSSILR